MAFDKVQVLRNILKKLNRSGWEMPFDLQTIDSLDEKALTDYFMANISTAGVIQESENHPYALTYNRTEMLMVNDWTNFSDKYFEGLMDGAVFFAKNDPTKKTGVRVNIVNDQLMLYDADDIDKALEDYETMADYKEELDREQRKLDKATEYINSTPRPKAPGFFAKLFNTKSNKEYKAYQAQEKICAESSKKIQDLATKISALTPQLKNPEPLNKEREFAEIKPKAVAKEAPAINKTVEKNVEVKIIDDASPDEDFDFGDDVREDEGVTIDDNGDIVLESETGNFFEMKPGDDVPEEDFDFGDDAPEDEGVTIDDNGDIVLESETGNFFETKPKDIPTADDWLEEFRRAREQDEREAEQLRAEAEKQRLLEEKLKEFNETREEFNKAYKSIDESFKKQKDIYGDHPALTEFIKHTSDCMNSIRSFYHAIDRQQPHPAYKRPLDSYIKLVASAKILNEMKEDFAKLDGYAQSSGIIPEDCFTAKILDKKDYQKLFNQYCNSPEAKKYAEVVSKDIKSITAFAKRSDKYVKEMHFSLPEKVAEKESGPSLNM